MKTALLVEILGEATSVSTAFELDLQPQLFNNL